MCEVFPETELTCMWDSRGVVGGFWLFLAQIIKLFWSVGLGEAFKKCLNYGGLCSGCKTLPGFSSSPSLPSHLTETKCHCS